MALATQVPPTSAPRRAGSTISVVISACLAQVMIVLDTTIIAVALPSAQAGLGFADADRQWTITAYTLAFGSLLLLGGRISQAIGIRWSFLIGLMGFAAACLLAGLATATWVLIAARVLQGVFAALLAPTNLSMMNTAFPGSRDRAKAFALFGAVAGAGAAIGLILGGVLTEALSWRWCFFVSVPLAIIAGLVALGGLRSLSGRHSAQGPGDVLGLILGTTGVFALVYGFSRAETESWSDPLTVILLVAGLALLSLFLLRQRVARDPLLPLAIISDRVRAASYLAIATVGLAQMSSSLYLTFYFQDQLGYAPITTGLLFLPLVGGLIVAAVVSTRVIVPRFGVAIAYPAGGTVLAIAFSMFSTIGPDSPFGDQLTLPLILGGAGIGLLMAPAMSAATAGTTVRYSGVASATANTSQQIGASLGVAFLSSWAAQRVVEGLAERRDEVAARSVQALVEAGVAPTSPQGTAIVEQVRQQVLASEIVAAYGSGFLVMAAVGLGLAVATALLLWPGGRRTTAP